MSKTQASSLPPPFQFNAWKHHLLFIKKQLKQIETREELQQTLPVLGSSVMDLYTGNLLLPQIQTEIKAQLETRKVYHSSAYTQWLREDAYRIIRIHDQSLWTLRQGDLPQFYIHFHPARYSPHSFRIKANLLKTAILLAWHDHETDLATINHLRSDVLQLSPVKKAEPGLLEMIRMLRNS